MGVPEQTSNVRFRATWTSMTGILYEVNILDATLSSSTPTLIDLGTDGFVINYEGDTNNLTKGIIPSSCSISMLIPDSTIEAFIDDVANAAENRFFIDIYQGSGHDPFWRGNIIPDLCSHPDADYPYTFNIKAIDGLAKLKDITFSRLYPQPILDDIINILSRLDTSAMWGSTDNFLATAVNWYNSVMGTPSINLDPLSKILAPTPSYTYLDSKKKRQNKNCYDILEMIATMWNAHIFLTRGMFYFIQINEIKNTTTNVRYYDISGSNNSTSTPALEITGIKRTGIFSYLRPIKIVSIENDYWTSYIYNRLPALQDYTNSIDVGMFSASNGEILEIHGNIELTVSDNNNLTTDNKFHFVMKLNVGNYYLENPGGVFGWTTNSSAVVDIYSSVHSNFNFTETISISINTPEIPEFGISNFSLYFLQIEDINGTQITPQVTMSTSYSDFSLKQSVMADTVQQKFSETGTTDGTNYEKKLPEISMGDGPSSDADTKLQVYNDSSSSWEESRDNWTEGGVGTPTWINQLLVQKNLALQSTARLKFNGTIANVDYHPFETFTINNYKFTLLSASFYANRNEWRGYFHEIKET